MQDVRIQGNPTLKEGPGQPETEIDVRRLGRPSQLIRLWCELYITRCKYCVTVITHKLWAREGASTNRWFLLIAVTWHDHHGVSNHRKLDGPFNSLLSKLTPLKKQQKSALLLHYEANPQVDSLTKGQRHRKYSHVMIASCAKLLVCLFTAVSLNVLKPL